MEDRAVLMIMPMVASVGFFSLVAWIVYVIVDGRRRREQLRVMSEFHTKILEKMGSTADFGAFLETDGGKRFMKSLAVEGPSAKTRMLGSTQTGIVCTMVGLALLILGGIFYYLRDGLWVIGGVVTACGIGFILSTAASYRLSKSLGLLEGQEPDRR